MRYTKFISLFALALAFSLTLGAAPQTAEAGKICKKMGMKKDCVKSSDVKNLKATDSKDEAGLDFALTPDGAAPLGLPAFPVTLRSVNITAPMAGHVVVNATAMVAGGAIDVAFCGLSFNGVSDGGAIAIAAIDPVITATSFDTIAITHAFPVPAGSSTISLDCFSAGATMLALVPNLTAVYAPTVY